jgi:hypothetical protein
MPLGIVMSATVAININRTGSKMVKSVSANPGEFLRSAFCVNCSLIPPSATGTLRPMKVPTKGPAMTAVGKPMISE